MAQSGDLQALSLALHSFAEERDWEQFHSPKNLAMALTVEAAELQELFQWLTEDESFELPTDQMQKVRQEVADVLIYLVRLSDQLGIDVIDAANDKMALNEQKYPASLVKGKSKKYSEY